MNVTTIKEDATSVSDVKSPAITPVDVKFHEDTVPAFVGNDGEVYAAVNQVLRNIGFNEERVKAIKIKWRDDAVISARGRNFDLWYSGGVAGHFEDTYCLSHKILPLALAKITITPTLKKEYPAVVEKLISYQLECADVLYQHFFNQTEVKETVPTIYSDPTVPITREELGLYLTSYMEEQKEFYASLTSAVNLRLDAIEKSHQEVANGYSALKEGYTSLKDGYTALKGGYADLHKGIVTISKSHDTVLKSCAALQDGYTVLKDGYKDIRDALSVVKSKYEVSEDRADKLESALTKAMWKISSSVVVNSTVPGGKSVNNPQLANTLSGAKTKKWLNDAWTSAEIIGRCSGHKPNYTMRELCEKMRANGVPLDRLYSEYQAANPTKASKINMIAESDYLRPLAEAAFKELHRYYLAKVYEANAISFDQKDEINSSENKTDVKEAVESKKVCKSQLVNGVPFEVKELLQQVATKKEKTLSRAAVETYKEIESRTQKNLKDLAASYAETIGYKNCSKAYYVSQNKDMMEILKEIAEEK